LIVRRTNKAYWGDELPEDPRPWLHHTGMTYEDAGIAPHDAEPEREVEP
jgi:hypothetical protein